MRRAGADRGLAVSRAALGPSGTGCFPGRRGLRGVRYVEGWRPTALTIWRADGTTALLSALAVGWSQCSSEAIVRVVSHRWDLPCEARFT